MISQIEIEKIFTGDPALYKYKANKADKLTPVTIDHTIHTDEGNSVQI